MVISLKVVKRLKWNFNTMFASWSRLRGCPGLLNSNSRWRRPPFWNQLNGHNSTIYERIWAKFDTDTESKISGQCLPSGLECNKIQGGGGRHIENHIFDHNSAIIPRICTEFETRAEDGVPQTDLPSEFTRCNNPRWRRPPFWNPLNDNNSAIYERICCSFAPNLIQTSRIRSLDNFCPQNSNPTI